MINQIVDSAVKLAQSRYNEDMLKCIGTKSYVLEMQTLNLRLPRQVGKSQYILRTASRLSDIILYPSLQLMNSHKHSNQNAHYLPGLDLEKNQDIFARQYSIIWLDEFESSVFKDKETANKLNSFIHTGREIFVNLTSR
jgi:hypothetical protein